MSEEQTNTELQIYLGILPNSIEGKVISEYLTQKAPSFLKFAKGARKEKQYDALVETFLAGVASLGYENADQMVDGINPPDWVKKLIPVTKKALKKTKASKKHSHHHPILSYPPEEMKVFVDKVRTTMKKNELPPLRAANMVLSNEYGINEPLMYLALKNAILHRYAPDLIPADQSPTPSPRKPATDANQPVT